jgi:integrase
MPRHAKGPRLWLRPARTDGTAAAWFVLDGTRQRGTGLGTGASERQKEDALKAYLAEKHTEDVSIGSRDPTQVLIADVLAKYVRDKERDYETLLRIVALRKFWGTKRLSEVTGDNCRAYAATRTSGAARREMEDFRSAINHHRREGLHDKIVSVVLPEKPEPRENYLTHEEAAHLILTTWRYRETQNFRATDRRTRKHVARFMVVGRYMGSRAGVICEASIEPKRPKGRAWVNLTTGMFYGLPQGRRQNKKRRQLVRIPLPLLAHMRRWRRAGQRYVVEWNGEPIQRITKAHNAAVVTAEMGPEITPHIWRHSVATWLMQAGVDPFKAAGFLAMSVETLLRVYGHHHPDHSSGVYDVIKNKKRAA